MSNRDGMFDSYIAHHARLRPEAPAVLTLGRAIGFGELDAAVTRTARLLRALEVRPDRAVAVAVDDLYLHWLVTLALARLGVPSSPGADRDCALRVTDRTDADATLVIGPREVAAIVSGPAADLPPMPIAADGIGRIMLSSGTTGDAKRIALGWRAIDAGIRNVPIAYGAPSGPWLMETGVQTILGFVLTLGCWALGNPVLMLEDALDGHRLHAAHPALIGLTPAQLDRLVDDLPADAARRPLRVVAGGGPVPAPLLARTRERLTDDVLIVYGASECGAIAVATPALRDRAPEAAGAVLPGVTVEIVDDRDRVVAPGETGHVRVRSDRMADGYLRGPAAAFREGWFRPGDLGWLDARGVLVLDGRSDDLMNLGGQKVLPAWIEAAALAAPGVREAAAFSATDGDGRERCWLALVADDGFDERTLGPLLAPQLAAAETIRWFRLDRLPRNAAGKIERTALRAQARALMTAG